LSGIPAAGKKVKLEQQAIFFVKLQLFKKVPQKVYFFYPKTLKNYNTVQYNVQKFSIKKKNQHILIPDTPLSETGREFAICPDRYGGGKASWQVLD
jgi:hypothetical protein